MIRASQAATVTFGEQLEWLEHENDKISRGEVKGLPEGTTAQLSMYNMFPIRGNPMSEAWNSESGTVALKMVVDYAQFLVDEHEVADDARLTLELLLQAIRHPDSGIDIENAEVHV